ncbi:ankyrin repeat-containing protein At5g02620-like isoform X2 [Hordeum vulgare subsp. vulgare]|uniref:ankyrin repeat-containing protein At5g02620-like isoform X2 n=1 Tax=Hordeum vulgare subsp. vulgare TaxID=112509 RepID=UPI001D1A4F6B|nr:ankyrin repeat-containing protein At5g02620-like isoform X2 [Hordeum vulgare subsp. vulgare]
MGVDGRWHREVDDVGRDDIDALLHSIVPIRLLLFLPCRSNSRPPATGHRLRCCCCCSTAEIVKAIRVHELGGPEALQWEEVVVGEPGDGEIRISNTAIGVNFIDVCFRKGVYPASLPFTAEMVDLLLQWRPSLTNNLDTNKSSPVHFTASDGDCSIIEALLTHSPPSTAYLQDSDGVSALHAAALMGHVAAVRLLLELYPSCADIRDNRGRSFVHVAAMKGRSSVVSYVIKSKMLEHLLNMQDKEGNTPLHLAVAAGEHKVISKLLACNKVHTHMMNNAGRTPSDLIEDSTGFYSMIKLVVKLYIAGARFRPERQDHIEKWKGQDIIKWRETTSKNLAIVSTLVATIAFSAAFNVPGSYGSDGKANLDGDRFYNAFLVLDTIAVTTSVVATILLIYGRASRTNRSWIGFIVSMHFLWVALNSMMLAFFMAIAAVVSDKNPMKIALSQLMYGGLYILMTLLASFATPGSFLGVVRFLVGGCSAPLRRSKRRISRQFPFVVYYAFNVIVFIIVNTIVLVLISVAGRLPR